MGYIGEKARGERLPAKELLIDKFGDTIVNGGVSAQYVRFGKAPVVIGVSGLRFDSMAVNLLASDDIIFEQFTKTINEGYSILLVKCDDGVKDLIEECLTNPKFKETRAQAREEIWQCRGEGASNTADYIVAKLKQLEQKEENENKKESGKKAAGK